MAKKITHTDEEPLDGCAKKIFTYYHILEKIKSEGYINRLDLAIFLEEKLYSHGFINIKGTSISTIGRDIKALKAMDVDIESSRKGYHIASEINPDFAIFLQNGYLSALLNKESILRGFIYAENRQSKGTEYLSLLIEAIKDSKRVEFKYRKFDNTVTKEKRIVEPYALKEFKSRWYLLAVEIDGRLEERGQIKTWGLDRIENLFLSNKPFTKRKNINIEDEFKNAFGIFSNEEKDVEEVVLSFTAMNGKYNEALPLHESQETLPNDENDFRIKLNVKITYDFIMELLAQSQGMRVIAPLHLRDTLISIHKEAIKSLEKKL